MINIMTKKKRILLMRKKMKNIYKHINTLQLQLHFFLF